MTSSTGTATKSKGPKKVTGVVVRHSRSCPTRGGGKCGKPCTPAYEGWVWDPRSRKKIKEGFSTIAAAKAWRADATGAVRRGTLTAPSPETVRQAAVEWLAKAQTGEIVKPDGTGYKPSVLRTYESDLRRHVLPEIGETRLAKLQRRDVQALVDHLVGLGLSGSRVRGALMPLRAVCRRAIKRDEILVNPCANLDLPGVAGTRDRAAAPAEAEQLLAALPESERSLWGCAMYAGLRRGELRALRCSDVDTEARVIRVERGWDDVEGAIEPKSKKGTRRVPITSDLRLLLLEHMARTGRRGADLVFGRTAAAPFTPTHVRARARKAWAAVYACGCKIPEKAKPEAKCEQHAAGRLEPIGLHECRHSYVSLMHAAGVPLERIGDYVGHSSTFMVDRYRHLLDGHEAEAADRLDSYLARSVTSST